MGLEKAELREDLEISSRRLSPTVFLESRAPSSGLGGGGERGGREEDAAWSERRSSNSSPFGRHDPQRVSLRGGWGGIAAAERATFASLGRIAAKRSGASSRQGHIRVWPRVGLHLISAGNDGETAGALLAALFPLAGLCGVLGARSSWAV